jgi:hypothetical protein
VKAHVKLDGQAGQSTRLAKITGVGSVVVALLASQHHLLHMLILLATLGAAGMSGMTGMTGYPPLVRQGMLLMSVVMVGVTIWQMRTWKSNRPMIVFGVVSITLTLGLIVWSITQYGL